jgi:F0F1-type ATP synthase beta subunit
MKIVLIACASKKLGEKAKARNIYTSTLFKLNLKYAQSLNPDKIFVISAKHGMLDLNEEIEPYNETLNKMKIENRKLWAEKVLEQLKKISDIEKDEIIFLAGKKYREFLIPHIKNYKVPLMGLGIGKQLKFLKENIPF